VQPPLIDPLIHQSIDPSPRLPLHPDTPSGKLPNPKTPQFRLISPKITRGFIRTPRSENPAKPNENAKIASSRSVSSEIRSEIPFPEHSVRKIPKNLSRAEALREGGSFG